MRDSTRAFSEWVCEERSESLLQVSPAVFPTLVRRGIDLWVIPKSAYLVSRQDQLSGKWVAPRFYRPMTEVMCDDGAFFIAVFALEN